MLTFIEHCLCARCLSPVLSALNVCICIILTRTIVITLSGVWETEMKWLAREEVPQFGFETGQSHSAPPPFQAELLIRHQRDGEAPFWVLAVSEEGSRNSRSVSPSFHRWENWGPQRLSSMLRVTIPLKSRAVTRMAFFPSYCTLTSVLWRSK